MNKAVAKIKATFEEYPVETVAIAASAITAATKLAMLRVAHKNSRTWQKEVNRRSKMSK